MPPRLMDDPSSIVRMDMAKRENWLPRVVLGFPHDYTHTINTYM